MIEASNDQERGYSDLRNHVESGLKLKRRCYYGGRAVFEEAFSLMARSERVRQLPDPRPAEAAGEIKEISLAVHVHTIPATPVSLLHSYREVMFEK